ncbi:MAG: hypothetical protein J5527_06655, partial [Treponema sp.]|nr:hypothetical protein [Treponema sp.]
MKKGKLFAVLTAVISIFWASCEVEIGLGAAVDTEAPKLKVYEASNDPADPNYKPVPKAGDVVRSYFMLAGQATDDKEIKSLTITFKNLRDTNAGEIDFSVTPDALTGEWAIIIDPTQEIAAALSDEDNTNDPKLPEGMKAETKKIPDGEYQVTFTVVDNVSHETIVTRQFTIDNTPPVIVIDRPSSKDDADQNEIDSYGQSFTLEGQAADDNDVARIDVMVFDVDDDDPDATPKITITKENIPSRINMDIATFSEGVQNDYSKIYGSDTTEGAKTNYFNFKLAAYDGAVKYPVEGVPSEEDKLGNKTNTYYLYEDISTIFADYGIKITDVYHMFNGSYNTESTDSSETSERAQETVEEIKGFLQKDEIQKGIFSLNPENSPTFTVTGRKQLEVKGVDKDDDGKIDFSAYFGDEAVFEETHITNGSSLTIEVTPGLDAIALLSEKDCEEYIAYGESYQDDPVGNKSYSRYNKYLSEKYAKLNEETNRYESIYLFRPYFIEIEEVTDAEGNISFKEIGERIYPLQTTEPNKANYLDSSIKKSGSNYKFTVQILKDDGFQFRKNYKVGVEGYDRSGNKIMDTGKGYGFRFVSGGAAPTIVVQYPLETLTRVKKGDGILLQGVISTEDGSPVVTVLKQGEDDEKEIEITTWEYEEGEGVENKISGLYDFTYEYRIPETWFSQAKSQQYKIILRATNGKRASEDEKTVLYDVDGPEISLTEVKPVIEKAGKDCINKKFSVKGSINDKFDNVSSAKWELVEKGEGE